VLDPWLHQETFNVYIFLITMAKKPPIETPSRFLMVLKSYIAIVNSCNFGASLLYSIRTSTGPWSKFGWVNKWGTVLCVDRETSMSLPAFNAYCSFTNNPTAKAIPLWNNDVQCKVKQQMCETLWNELMHNFSGIVKAGRPIKRIKVTRYDVLFIIFRCGSHKI
jgi:hypothetical protein